MIEIPDSLRVLYEAEVDTRDDEYVLSVPESLVENGSLSTGDAYRVALIEADDETEPSEPAEAESESQAVSSADGRSSEPRDPPVSEGDTRTVTIETLGDQGDGIAKVERGFIVIVPDTRPGDQVEVEITDVKSSVAFAETIGRAEVR